MEPGETSASILMRLIEAIGHPEVDTHALLIRYRNAQARENYEKHRIRRT